MEQIDDLIFDHLDLLPNEVDYIIYHFPCVDGFASAYCFYNYLNKYFPDKQVTYHPTNYNKPVPYNDIKGKNVLICDFSYKKHELQKIISLANKFAILDHHKTAQNELIDIYDKYKLFRMDHSGAYLAWRYFHRTEKVPKMIIYIEDNDIWLKQQHKTLEFTAFIHAIPFEFEEYDKLMNEDYILNTVFIEGSGMVKQNMSIINSSMKYVVPKFVQIKDKYYFVSYLNSCTLKSELGNHAFNEYENINFSATYSINDQNNSTSFSLRSISTATDVSEIALIFGGGGHRSASGVMCHSVTNILPTKHLDSETSYKLLNNIYFCNLNDDSKTRIVLLNSYHNKKALGKYLLQKRYTINDVDVQECMSIKKKYTSNDVCNLSVIWHYDGGHDKIWYTVTFNVMNKEYDELHEYLSILLFDKDDCMLINASCFVFTTRGNKCYF